MFNYVGLHCQVALKAIIWHVFEVFLLTLLNAQQKDAAGQNSKNSRPVNRESAEFRLKKFCTFCECSQMPVLCSTDRSMSQAAAGLMLECGASRSTAIEDWAANIPPITS